MNFDSILLLAYGGPEKPEDIRPFLRNVTRGRPIPDARLEKVAHHYELIGGRSPLNDYTFAQADAVEEKLQGAGYDLKSYVGMRHWRPLIPDTVRRMIEDGCRRVVGLIMVGHQSETSWAQYQRNVADALGETDGTFDIVYTEPLFDHPLFIETSASHIAACFERIPEYERDGTRLVFTAHSIPSDMASSSPYEAQLMTSCRLIAGRLQHDDWQLAYQSRSGRPQDPWLEPDICDLLTTLADQKVRHVVVMPIGFICDHVEVLFDLDYEAFAVAESVGITMYRAEGMNTDPLFIDALVDRVEAVIKAQQTDLS